MEKSIFEVLPQEEIENVAGGISTRLALTRFCSNGRGVEGDYTYHVSD